MDLSSHVETRTVGTTEQRWSNINVLHFENPQRKFFFSKWYYTLQTWQKARLVAAGIMKFSQKDIEYAGKENRRI